MKEQIEAALRRIEITQGVEVLFAVESGSRAWGFASDDSDWDVRFVYRRPLSWYLSVVERRDVIECPGKELDISGWDIRKALFQCFKSNPMLFEWLHSPEVYVDDGTIEKLKKVMGNYFNSKTAMFHYLHLASGNYKKYVLGKEECSLKRYFYITRCLFACEWVDRHQQQPPIEFQILMGSSSTTTQKLRNKLEQMLIAKQAGELTAGPPDSELNEWIEAGFERWHHQAVTAGRFQSSVDELNALLFEIVVPDFLR